MKSIRASVPCSPPPTWAVLERHLIDVMDRATQPFLDRYVREDGELIWREGGTGSRDGADDFYEATYNWPLFYLLGGGDHLLTQGQRIWEGITRQLTRAGMLRHEYELGYDQFHQGESYIYFYFLCLADPEHAAHIARAQRFAGFYLNEEADAPNYDAEHKLIRAAHNGSGGPRWGFSNVTPPSYNWGAGMRIYGLPFRDLPDIEHYDDLEDPANARRMGQAMHERMGKGDVAGNLIVTSLVTNAYLLTGLDKYRTWVTEYVDAWIARAEQNGGLLPDNVGLDGEIGSAMEGKWYGGLYGWSWPHGYYNIGMAATVAGLNAYLLTREARYLDLPRSQYDIIRALGEVRDVRTLEMSIRQHWVDQLENSDSDHLFVAPYRYADRIDGDQPGWFDYQPLSPVTPTAVWNVSGAEQDWQRIEALRESESYDWARVTPFRNKEEGGHEQPWLRYLAGENPTYPERMLGAALTNVHRRLALIAVDDADLTQVNIHHWQEHNPVVTEALVQLTLGAPQIVYNGGLLHARLRYFDSDRDRPGLPPDVAALVEGVEPEHTTLHLVNLSPVDVRTVVIQAGAFGEHQFTDVAFTVCSSDYPGSQKQYAAAPLETTWQTLEVHDRRLKVLLPAATQVTLRLGHQRYVNTPSYR